MSLWATLFHRNKPSVVLSGKRLKILLVLLGALAVAVVWVSNQLLTERFTETTRNRADVRLTLYTGNLMSELQRNSIVPQLLSRDPTLITALDSGDYSQSTSRLLSFVDEIGAASLILLDVDGRVVAATDRQRIGENLKDRSYFIDALRTAQTVFSQSPKEASGYDFVYSRRMGPAPQPTGVIVVEVDLGKLERSWSSIRERVLVTDSSGEIILATEPRWRTKAEGEALAETPPSSSIARAVRVAQDFSWPQPDIYLDGAAFMRREARVPFHGWKMVSYTSYASVRERVNGILAFEIMIFALILTSMFYWLSRRATTQVERVERESAELRSLNQRLQREIANRHRAERHLEVAEQSLEQSSKLAALGEMSAAVSHELNQPLAAMKTYLAGSRLLLDRRRYDEAHASFGRIDDLIERMGGITKQLKSYARKGSDTLEPMDARAAVSSAIALMEPQLRSRRVEILCNLPSEPVMVRADRLRFEQVVVNLLRNGIDATRTRDTPRVEVLLTTGETMNLSVTDNGHGIADIGALFEPFYTTKAPGDGVGLGLAISSGIITEHGGRLTAHNSREGGAVFVVELPIYETMSEAAE